MDLSKIPPGRKPPEDVNVVIEITAGAHGGLPVKYEIDPESGALFVDRIVSTAMFYPFNYGFVPNTLAPDGDPVDVLLRSQAEFAPGSVARCRLIGVLRTEDDSGHDDKLIAAPLQKVDPFQAEVRSLEDLPPVELERIRHFTERRKDLEQGKWVKVGGWGDKAEAEAILMKAIEAAGRGD